MPIYSKINVAEPGGTIRQTRTEYSRQKEDIAKVSKFLKKWQKDIAKRMTKADWKLADTSRKLRQEEYAQLRKDHVRIGRGTYPDYVRIPQGSFEDELLNNICGGFEFKRDYLAKQYYQTGCGLYVTERNCISEMWYMDVNWCFENDNVLIHCPYHKKVYQEHALERSSSSKAIAYVGIKKPDGALAWGAGVDPDIIRASIDAR